MRWKRKSMKRKIIISFDYELFFGEQSGTVLKTLIEPTKMLLDSLDVVNAKGNFFVDYLMFKYLEPLSGQRAQADLQLLKEQIRDIVRRGHRIELHLHPHWIDAKYNGDGTWDYSDFTHYSLSSLDEPSVIAMFKEGADYLNSLAREVVPDYRICAFRAGGWAIQPFEKIKKGFLAAGIRIDSSVAADMQGKNQYSWFDFTTAPHDDYWYFENDVCRPDSKGQFVEIPITTVTRTFFNKMTDLLMRKTTSQLKKITDGTHDRNDIVSVRRKKMNNASMMTFSAHSPLTVVLNLFSVKSPFCVLIDHPKDFTMSNVSSIKWIGRLADSVTYFDYLER